MHPRVFASSHPNHLAAAMADGSASITYGQLESRANQAAHYIRSLGIETGDSLAMWLPNCVEFLEVYWAAQRAGLFICPISTQLSAKEAAYILNDSGAKLLVTDMAVKGAADFLADAHGLAPNTQVVMRQDWSQHSAAFPSKPIADESAGQQMVYSSGTTGTPKGIRVPLAGTPAVAPYPRADLMRGKYGFDTASVLLTPAPLYHTAPLVYATVPQRLGATIMIMEKFDPEQWLHWVQEYRVTFVQMVPTMFIRLLKLPQAVREKYDLSSLTGILHAAAPCPIDVKRAMIDWLGPIIYEYYAGSEGIGATAITAQEWLRKPGSVGREEVGVVHICDDDGVELDANEEGLVYFSGGGTFTYLNDPVKTREAMHPTQEGWATLGDIGRKDEDGYLFLTDRRSFTIISGGVNIYPQEVENLLIQHPKVADVAVIGVPNAEMGEEVKAVVQPAEWGEQGGALAEELMTYCRDNLSHFKCPKSIDFDPQLPRHETGKLYKQAIKKKYWPAV